MLVIYKGEQRLLPEIGTKDLFKELKKLIDEIKNQENPNELALNRIIALYKFLKNSSNSKKIYFEYIKRKADELYLYLSQYTQSLFTNKTYPQIKLLKNIFGNNASESHN